MLPRNNRGMALAPPRIESAPVLTPPLKWAGGKRWLVPRLLELWRGHEDRRLVEPFVGGLAVTLGLRPRWALLNDLNPHLISFYRTLQRGLDLRATGITTENDRAVYAANRNRFNELVREGRGESPQAAALFYYLNRTGYNGLCRFNARGVFNVPFGRYKNLAYDRDFLPFKAALSRYEFTCSDFETIDVQPLDFVYADPPYDVEFTSYFAGGFDWEAQKRLAHWLAAHRGPVVASNQVYGSRARAVPQAGFYG